MCAFWATLTGCGLTACDQKADQDKTGVPRASPTAVASVALPTAPPITPDPTPVPEAANPVPSPAAEVTASATPNPEASGSATPNLEAGGSPAPTVEANVTPTPTLEGSGSPALMPETASGPAPALEAGAGPKTSPLPHFKSAAANEYIQAFEAYLKDFRIAYDEMMKKADLSKYSQIIAKAQEMQVKGEQVGQDLDPDEQDAFAKYLDAKAEEISRVTGEKL